MCIHKYTEDSWWFGIANLVEVQYNVRQSAARHWQGLLCDCTRVADCRVPFGSWLAAYSKFQKHQEPARIYARIGLAGSSKFWHKGPGYVP